MIENVTKHVRRKGTVDDEYIQTLYADVTSLYHLDQIAVDDTVRQELGELPKTAATLLWSLAGAWVCIICYASVDYLRKKSAKKEKQY